MLVVLSGWFAFQLIPARGRKLNLTGDEAERIYKFQLIPARGRKLRILLQGFKEMLISTYPRKGTETYLLLWLMKNIRFQLIPARGRKHFHLSIEIMMCIISTYPRKGTETALVNHLVPEVLDFNLSPQGDGNGTQTESLMIDLIFQLIPARGRKPLLHPVRAAGLNNFNLSPQGGKKLRIKKRCGVFLLRALTFRFSWAFSL